jgi:hypothetical protein
MFGLYLALLFTLCYICTNPLLTQLFDACCLSHEKRAIAEGEQGAAMASKL